MTGKQVIDRCSQLEQIRSPHEYLWNEVGFLTNAKYYGNKGTTTKGFIPHAEIYDTSLRTKGRMQANGITSMLFPRDRDWIKLLPPFHLRKETHLQKFYNEAGEAILHYLRQSNFHHQNHGVIVSRSFQGTGCMAMEWLDDEGMPNFRRHQTMHYLIDHDTRSKVDTFACKYYWSAARAAEEWGIENLSSKLQTEARDNSKRCELHTFIFMVVKRPSWERDGEGNKGMDFAVYVVEEDSKHVILESGMDKFPVVASRYEVYDSPWGYSPAWEVLPDAYKANYAAKFMMVMGERAAVPPVVAPASMKEEGVGLGAGMVTYVADSDSGNWPRELGSASNYNIGMEVWKQLRDSIDESYHGHLFNMFSRATRERTATEITALQGELNAQLDPTITALNQDHTDPVVSWMFDTLAENGVIDVPDEALDEKTAKAVMPVFAYENSFTMNHRQANALKAMEMLGFMSQMAAQGVPVDVAKMDEVARRIWRDQGLNEDDLLSEQEYIEQQDAKAEMAEKQQAMQAAGGMAAAAKDASAAGLPVEEMMGM